MVLSLNLSVPKIAGSHQGALEARTSHPVLDVFPRLHPCIAEEDSIVAQTLLVQRGGIPSTRRRCPRRFGSLMRERPRAVLVEGLVHLVLLDVLSVEPKDPELSVKVLRSKPLRSAGSKPSSSGVQ